MPLADEVTDKPRARAADAATGADFRAFPLDRLPAMTETIGLVDLPESTARILAGRIRGRVVVDHGP